MMERSAVFSLACTDEAQRELDRLVRANADSVVALLYARRNGEPKERWYVGYYDSNKVPSTGVFGDVGSSRIFFPQSWLIPQLSGKTIRLVAGEFAIE